jgi:hypothetical protein
MREFRPTHRKPAAPTEHNIATYAEQRLDAIDRQIEKLRDERVMWVNTVMELRVRRHNDAATARAVDEQKRKRERWQRAYRRSRPRGAN